MTTAELPLKKWQLRALLEIAEDSYADPKNRQAFEAWQKERRRARRAAKNKSPPVQRTPASFDGVTIWRNRHPDNITKSEVLQ